MRTFTAEEQIINKSTSEDYPINCLAARFTNSGESRVFVGLKAIEPNESHNIPAISGFYLEGSYELKVTETTGNYGTRTTVLVEYFVETTKI